MKRTLIALLTVAVIGGILFSGCVAPPPEPPPEAPDTAPEPTPEVIPTPMPTYPSGAPSLPIKINLFISERPTLGRTVKVTAAFYLETGYQDAHNITVRIILPEGFEKTSGDLEWKGDIIRGQNYFFKARVEAIKPGTWEIAAQADSKSGGMVGYATLSVSVPDIVFNLPDIMLPPPWDNVSYYFDASKIINTKAGEEFAIGFDTLCALGGYWQETHDEEMLATMDRELVMREPAGLTRRGTTWFLFKALQAGETQITFKYYEPRGELRDQQVFNIEIE